MFTVMNRPAEAPRDRHCPLRCITIICGMRFCKRMAPWTLQSKENGVPRTAPKGYVRWFT